MAVSTVQRALITVSMVLLVAAFGCAEVPSIDAHAHDGGSAQLKRGEWLEAWEGEPLIYMGKLEEIDAWLAVSVAPDGFTDIYVCGGDGTFDKVSRWFCPSDLTVGAGPVHADRDDWTITAARSDPMVTGRLRSPEGKQYDFEATLKDPGQAGLFLHIGSGVNNCSGVIVWTPEGEDPKMVGTYCHADGSVKQVTPIIGAMPEPDHAIIKVMSGIGDEADEVRLKANFLL